MYLPWYLPCRPHATNAIRPVEMAVWRVCMHSKTGPLQCDSGVSGTIPTEIYTCVHAFALPISIQ
eukprot:SAG31_NODE_12017_length_977_cov_1.054670_3_plen_64_part_01